MASSIYIVDAAFKRTLIKVTPGKYLREVLDDVCKSKKLNPESYTLKTQAGKLLDLSQPFRLSGLSAGAKLQLVQASRSPSVVNVALSLPESEGGGRLSDKFPSTTSLWLVLRKFEEGVAGGGKKLNLTQRGKPSGDSGAGRLLYEAPYVNVMGRTLEGFGELQKTLAQLGLNGGSCMLRLGWKMSDVPIEIAMGKITEFFVGKDGAEGEVNGEERDAPKTEEKVAREETETNGDVLAAPIANQDSMQDVQPTPEPDGQVEAHPELPTPSQPDPEQALSQTPTSTTPAELPQTVQPTDGLSVFLPPSSPTPAAALHQPDPSIYDPTIAHAKAHQAALERSSRNTRLLSDKELDAMASEKAAKLSAVRSVTIRVRYPDQSMVETDFQASAAASEVYTKVRTTLQHSDAGFELRYLGEKGQALLPDTDKTTLVRGLGFRGKVLVLFAWKAEVPAEVRSGPVLREELRSRAQELKVDLPEAEAVASEAKIGEVKPEAPEKDKGKGMSEERMKKFLGFGKK
ncbi:hypothetical protein B0A48_07274 [Cryoendolithus antarcticus]|uniref:TUG ubiquitin-like domain-containing protein n=1 Tax=Cryoendolithus antarcticus TaxID=1507870 RepID=A0A1V8T839_9PEZI|nr:hypothetical protein B0A48_07274 [Cryoendolithus antarcticus]